jgi:hypothetical protein
LFIVAAPNIAESHILVLMVKFHVDLTPVVSIDEQRPEFHHSWALPASAMVLVGAAFPMGKVTPLNPSSHQAEIYKPLINQLSGERLRIGCRTEEEEQPTAYVLLRRTRYVLQAFAIGYISCVSVDGENG